jgi:hypothetical protein
VSVPFVAVHWASVVPLPTCESVTLIVLFCGALPLTWVLPTLSVSSDSEASV